MPETGYYSSKKTDDICEDVCGEVIIIWFSFFQIYSFFFPSTFLRLGIGDFDFFCAIFLVFLPSLYQNPR